MEMYTKKPIEDLEVRVDTSEIGKSLFEDPGFSKVQGDSPKKGYTEFEISYMSGCDCGVSDQCGWNGG